MKPIIAAMLFLVSCSLLPAAVNAQQSGSPETPQPSKSVYTNISGSKCKLIERDKETGASVRSCPGIGGYKLQVEDDDDRMSISVVAPDGKLYPLNYWGVITPAFSSLGSKAEWRVVQKRGKLIPMALIVRVNATEGSESRKVMSYLAVAKIAEQEICVTDKIQPGKQANEEARSAADKSSSKPCLQ